MKFDWDPEKALLNELKHNISFREAITVFFDETAFEDYDSEHSDVREKRFVRIGNSAKQLLRVSFTINSDEFDDEIIRIISARKGKTLDEELYDKYNRP